MSDVFWKELFGNAKEIIMAVGTIIALILTWLSNRKASAATKTVEKQKDEAQRLAQTLTERSNETQAIVAHTQKEMAQTREESRKLHQFIDTEVFMARATEATPSGRQPLEPLTGPLELK